MLSQIVEDDVGAPTASGEVRGGWVAAAAGGAPSSCDSPAIDFGSGGDS